LQARPVADPRDETLRIEEFSTRRAEVVERMERATRGFWAAQVAALDTRDRKEHVDLAQLREDWHAREAEHVSKLKLELSSKIPTGQLDGLRR
jgi:hypothetical protein